MATLAWMAMIEPAVMSVVKLIAAPPLVAETLNVLPEMSRTK